MSYNSNVIRRGRYWIVTDRGRSSGQGRHNKIHSKSYNSKSAKDFGGEQIKVFEFGTTVSIPSDNFNRVMEIIINCIEICYKKSK